MNVKKIKKGRKPLDDPKMPIRIYIQTSLVSDAGGEDFAKNIAYEAIMAAAVKLRKKKNAV